MSNVESYNNELEGISIVNSDDVLMTNLNIYDNHRNNIYIRESSNAQILNATVHGSKRNSDGVQVSGGPGVRIHGGGGHNLNNINAYENWGPGIYIRETGSPVSLGSGVNCYNNGMMNIWGSPNPWTSSIELYETSHVYINGSKTYSTQPSGSITQKYGIIVNTCNNIEIINNVSYGNGTQNGVKLLGTNTNVTIQ